jgi:hypothetical protein
MRVPGQDAGVGWNCAEKAVTLRAVAENATRTGSHCRKCVNASRRCLEDLAHEGFLMRTDDGVYRRSEPLMA